MELSDNVKNKLSALSDDYSNQLPDRYNEVYTTYRLARISSSAEEVNTLRLVLHKLAGSGATFGYSELSNQAKKLVHFLDHFLRRNELPGKEEWDSFESLFLTLKQICLPENVLNEIEELEEIEEEERKIDAVVSKDKKERKVINYITCGNSVIPELAEQLGYYGYTVIQVKSVGDITLSLEKGNCELLLLHTDILKENESEAVDLKYVKEKFKDRISIIFISDSGDFSLRMAAIRNGADAFFVTPVDMGRLVDKIDNLAAQVNDPPYHILIIDDDPEQIAYYALVLQQAGMITSVATDPKKVLQILVEAKPEIIIIDLYMPTCTGIELAAIIRQQEAFVNIPIIYFSVETDIEKQLEAYKYGGADGFISKPIKPEHLLSIIRTKAERNRSLRFLMERDSLTGLLNHSNLKENLSLEILRAKRIKSSLCFAMIDVDHFKNVNDTYGHPVGDRVLKSLARLLQDRLRRTDIIGRYGGEEFGVILLNTDGGNAVKVMNEVRENFSRIKHKSDGADFFVTFSCGIASFPGCNSAEELNSLADKALYESKESGRNKTTLIT